MTTRRSYLPEDSIYPFQGLNTQDSPGVIDPRFSPRALNVLTNEGVVTKRPGYYKLTKEELVGEIQVLVSFEALEGLHQLVALTTRRQYVYDALNDEWTDITAQDGGGSPVELTGSIDDFMDHVIAIDQTGPRLIFTNGVDPPRVWNGTGNFEIWQPTFDGFVTCKTLTMFYDHLILGGIIYQDSVEPRVVAWSDTGDFDEFEGGNAGAVLVSDMEGALKRLATLGDRLALYGDDSITVMTFIGGQAMFSIETLVRGTSLYSPRSVVRVGPYHLFCSKENVFLFDGSRSTRALADDIRRTYRQALLTKNPVRSFCFNDYSERKVFVVLHQNGSEASRIFVLRYDYYDPEAWRWDEIRLSDSPYCYGFLIQDSERTWLDPPDIQWDQDSSAWLVEADRELFPTRCFGSGSDVYLDDGSSTTDEDQVVGAFWESKDFTIRSEYKSLVPRWIEVELELRGVSTDVLVSTDGGLTFEMIGSVSLTQDFVTYRLPFDKRARQLRVKLQSTVPFEMNWLRVWLRHGGPR